MDENASDSPFEGGEGVVSVPDWTVLSIRRQMPTVTARAQ